jgi:tetratricopeptide (TPR) repeat protein
VSGEEGLLIVGAHTRLGYVYYRQGRYADAVKEYLAELQFLTATDHVLKERSLIELHQKLGAAYLRLGHEADARRHLKAATRAFEDRLASGADEVQTKYYAAIAYALQGDVDRAVKYLEPTFARLGALNRQRVETDPDLEAVRPALAARGLLG